MPKKPLGIEDLQQMLWRFAEHRVITVAGRTGVLGLLAARAATPDEVAAELDLDPRATGKLIRALAALHLLDYEGSEYRVNEELASCFCPGPGDFTPFLEHSHSLYDRWGENLEPWVRGQPWQTKKRDESGIQQFGAAMQAMGAVVAKRVASCLDLRRVKRLLDVGGGFGHYAKAFLEQNSEMTATVLDIEEVAAFGREQASGTPFASRIEFKAGSYLDDRWGTGYDMILLANVVHQENEDNAAAMMRRAASALNEQGRVVVVDFSIDDEQREHVMGTLFALNMRSFGDAYPEPKLRHFMEQAGFEDIQRTDISPLRWVIVGRRAAKAR